MEQIYDIELSVPLGLRKGTMRCEIQKEHVTGSLEMLGSTTDFQGTCTGERLEIAGYLKTFARKIPYEGIGTLKDGKIHMQLQNGKTIYELNGQLRKE